MKLNKLIIVLALVLTLSPVFAAMGSTQQTLPVETKNYGDTVSVVAGTTIKYSIDTLTLPPMENLTIGDLSGNELYVKVTAVEEDHEFDTNVIGTLVYFGFGIIFTKDTTVTVGEGYTALDVIIPTGSATPAIVVDGVPHFNVTEDYSPAVFVLDNNWAEHELFLQFAGFTVTSTADVFEASWENTTTNSLVEFSWRKSDGILTYLHIKNDNEFIPEIEATELEVTFLSMDVKGLDLTVGQVIELNADIAYLDIEATGDMIPSEVLTEIDELEQDVAEMTGQTIMKFVIKDIEGLYYTADTYIYDNQTNSLVKQDEDSLFLGFLGGIQAVPYPIEGSFEEVPLFAPAITTDYDIYTGYMVLANTLVGVYLDDFLAMIPDFASAGITFNNLEASFSVLEKRGYFYLRENIDVDIDMEGFLSLVKADTEPSFSLSVTATEEAWIAYSSTGILAGMRAQGTIDITLSSELSTLSVSGGQIVINFDFKLVNPNYNPPDPIGGGVIPGFTWFIAIPAIFAASATAVILRKRQ